MPFTHPQKRTSAAICTAPGVAAMAALRISGPEALSITEKIFSKKVKDLPSHTAHYGKILAEDGREIDNVILLVMLAPKTYTGEDTIEIFCHGGSLIPKKILERILEAGALAAQPGEFTLKAYLNKKIDLAQAEAVEQRISSQNEGALKASSQLLEGRLSKEIKKIQKKVVEKSAILEAWVDFPEEDLAFESIDFFIQDMHEIIASMQKLSDTFDNGRMLTEGIKLSLLGTPNVGKSSLMNALLGKERAIVTSIAGTTRDTLQEALWLDGMNFSLIDTAGIHASSDQIEQEGIKRSKKELEDADIILALFDASKGITKEDKKVLEMTNPDKTIYIINKIDIAEPPKEFPYPFVALSAKENVAIDKLTSAIDKFLCEKPVEKNDLIITSRRHKNHLDKAIQYLEKVVQSIKEDISAEFICSDIKRALEELGMIIGMNVTEEVLTSVFSTFCIGK